MLLMYGDEQNAIANACMMSRLQDCNERSYFMLRICSAIARVDVLQAMLPCACVRHQRQKMSGPPAFLHGHYIKLADQ